MGVGIVELTDLFVGGLVDDGHFLEPKPVERKLFAHILAPSLPGIVQQIADDTLDLTALCDAYYSVIGNVAKTLHTSGKYHMDDPSTSFVSSVSRGLDGEITPRVWFSPSDDFSNGKYLLEEESDLVIVLADLYAYQPFPSLTGNISDSLSPSEQTLFSTFVGRYLELHGSLDDQPGVFAYYRHQMGRTAAALVRSPDRTHTHAALGLTFLLSYRDPIHQAQPIVTIAQTDDLGGTPLVFDPLYGDTLLVRLIEERK